MNGKVSEKNFFIDGVSHKKKHPAWVCIQNAVDKRDSLLILLKYDAPILNLILNTFPL